MHGANKCVDRVNVICCWAAGKSREAEEKRINKELANIRSKFKGQFCAVVASYYNARLKLILC